MSPACSIGGWMATEAFDWMEKYAIKAAGAISLKLSPLN
jgi:hypothetical protein